MRPIEFELERTVRAPIDQVFARLIDIEGHNLWMADTGSMLKHTRKTSPGEPAVGTTFVDETSQGTMPGEIAELVAPHTIVFHWWEKSKSGRLTFEGWPSCHLQPSGDSETLVRHGAKLVPYAVRRLGHRYGESVTRSRTTWTRTVLAAPASSIATPRRSRKPPAVRSRR